MIKFDVITLFPQLFIEHINNLPFKKAIDKKLIEVDLINLRDFGLDRYGTVDDKTYGGGVGMVLMIEPIFNALCKVYKKYGLSEFSRESLTDKQKVILMSPRGKTYNQQTAILLKDSAEQVTLICGRYEGIDARVEQYFATDVVSIGNFVLSGGELPALSIMESITRLLPGVLEKDSASQIESFQESDTKVEYPQYTRPENFKGLKVPDVLLSGNHKEIEKWRNQN